jgi:hypothetical protein
MAGNEVDSIGDCSSTHGGAVGHILECCRSFFVIRPGGFPDEMEQLRVTSHSKSQVSIAFVSTCVGDTKIRAAKDMPDDWTFDKHVSKIGHLLKKTYCNAEQGSLPVAPERVLPFQCGSSRDKS